MQLQVTKINDFIISHGGYQQLYKTLSLARAGSHMMLYSKYSSFSRLKFKGERIQRPCSREECW